ncbi:hypothetical protein HZA26_03865 [Candidatus Nomurabacteria bacterium]|nr:hypothetical protein [Candidatus Nomurabacteria bacterium]
MPIIFKKNNKGLVLIEMIIYIALFSIIMSGLLVTMYQLSESTTNLSSKSIGREETNFVFQKISWALNGALGIAVPDINTLNIDNPNVSGSTMIVKFDNLTNRINFKKNSTLGFLPITTLNVNAESLNFTHLPAGTNTPEGVKINLTIDGVTTEFIKYLRQ